MDLFVFLASYLFYCFGSIVRAKNGKQTKPAIVIEMSQTINLAIEGITESNPFSWIYSLFCYYVGVSVTALDSVWIVLILLDKKPSKG